MASESVRRSRHRSPTVSAPIMELDDICYQGWGGNLEATDFWRGTIRPLRQGAGGGHRADSGPTSLARLGDWAATYGDTVTHLRAVHWLLETRFFCRDASLQLIFDAHGKPPFQPSLSASGRICCWGTNVRRIGKQTGTYDDTARSLGDCQRGCVDLDCGRPSMRSAPRAWRIYRRIRPR